ncbi:MAG: ShlB/FhaC/HecB family hemolysin secretion/activation protein [Planctomycetaceae bacterium]|nr:ShlB/FhaC/HecB family hemolysin secretion/activation protein [Planctomycetaceae bacterium]
MQPSIRFRTGIPSLLMGVIVSLACKDAVAQDAARYSPPVPIPRPLRVCVPLPQIPHSIGSDTVIVDELKGIMILGDEDRLQDPIAPFDGVRIDPQADLSVAHSEQFKSRLASCLGRPVSMQLLNDLKSTITSLYRTSNTPIVDVQIPAGQDITEGIVQIVITESTIGAVRFRGGCWFDECMLRQQNWLRHGDPLQISCLTNELVWYNRNPFREVSVCLEPGCEPGTTDIVYQVCDRKPVRFFMGYEDSGVQTTSRERLNAGFNWGNAGEGDRMLSYQYSADAQMSGIFGTHALSYQVPVWENRNTWELFGSWTDLHAPIGGGLTATGQAWQFSGRYHQRLSQTCCRTETMHFGFDVKSTDNDLDFGGLTVLNQEVEIVNFMAGINSRQRHSDGVSQYALDAFVSPGWLLGRNTSTHFGALRPGANATYGYLRGWMERLFELDQRSDFVVKATGQLATSSLLPTEQLGFGGYNTIRGYDMRTANADAGYILNFEYRRKPILAGTGEDGTALTLLAFTDVGQQFLYSGAGNQPDGDILASAGVGARYLIDPNCSLRIDYGVPFNDVGRNFHSSGRVHVGVLLAY